MANIRLPDLQARNRIVNADGTPTFEFHRFFNIDFSGALEGILTDLSDVQAALVAQQAEIIAIQAEQAAQIAAIQALLGIVNANSVAAQGAIAAANAAQSTADEALAGGTVSGSADNPAVTVPSGGVWVNGPQVDLVGVVAGNLTITGTGPIQDDDVEIVGIGSGVRNFAGQWRVQEIDGGSETTVFSGSFSGYQSGAIVPATISNDSAGGVSSFSDPRTSTGAISYRLDFLAVSGELTSLRGYIFARRAA